MPKTIWLVKYKYNGNIHTDGYCSGSEGNEEVDGIQYRFLKHPPVEIEAIKDEWIFDDTQLDKLKDKEHVCQVKGGSGYCEAYVHYTAIWARRVNKRKDREYLIRDSNQKWRSLSGHRGTENG
jgi:hypothetical protein